MINLPIHFCADTNELVKRICETRHWDVEEDNIWLKIGIDAGQGILKASLQINNASKHFVSNSTETISIIFAVDEKSRLGLSPDTFDLRIFVKMHLDKIGRKKSRWKNNFPGIDFTESFGKRYPELCTGLGQSIKSSRAAADRNITNSYFDNLESVVANVPAENILIMMKPI